MAVVMMVVVMVVVQMLIGRDMALRYGAHGHRNWRRARFTDLTDFTAARVHGSQVLLSVAPVEPAALRNFYAKCQSTITSKPFAAA